MSPEQDRSATFELILQSLLVAAGLAILIITAGKLLNLLILAFGATVISIIVRGVSDPLARWTGLPGRLSAVLVMLLIAAAIALLVWLFEQRIASQFDRLAEMIPTGWQSVREWIEQMPGGKDFLRSLQPDGGGNVLSRLVNAVGTIASAITDFLVILFGSLFITLDPALYRRGLVLLAPRHLRPLAEEVLEDSERALRFWMLGQLVSAVLIGTLVTTGLMLIGLPDAFALGLIAAIMEIIPYIGPIIAAIPALLVGLAESPQKALMTLAVYVLVQQAEGHLIMPFVQRKAVRLPAALTLFGLIAAGLLFGLIGVIFAAPLLVVAYVMVKRLYVSEALQTPTRIPGEKHE